MCFCHVGDGVFGCFFHDVAFLIHFVSPVEDGADDKGNGEHSGKELEGSAVAAGGFFHECQDERNIFELDTITESDFEQEWRVFKAKSDRSSAMNEYYKLDSEGESKFAHKLENNENVLLFTKIGRAHV